MPQDATEQDAAIRTLAWLVASNKPIYPLTVWWVTGEPVAGWWTALSLPLFLLLALKGQGLLLRAGVPVVGLLDTALAIKLFGAGGGGALFAAPIILIAALALLPAERWYALAIALAGGALVVLNETLGSPSLFAWNPAQTGALFDLNRISIVMLTLFVVWRFQPLRR